jgi:preprotein translocase subunit Sec61beta
MFFVFVLTVKLSMYLSRKLIISFLLTLVTLNSGALYADDYVQMIQFEMSFGGKQSESNLYMSMRSVGYSSQFDTKGQDTFRIPLISTDPRKISLLQPLSMLYAEEEPNNAEENIDETPNPVAAVGQAIGGVVLLAVMLAPVAVAISDMNSYDPCSGGACSIENYTIPDTFKVPADETGSDP